ncbi:hypothetical protein ACTXT7_004526 [Hymenolepis weldensis]
MYLKYALRKDQADIPGEKRVILHIQQLGTAEHKKPKSNFSSKELNDFKFEGRYPFSAKSSEFCKHPFGVKTATGVFQDIIDSMISRLKDTTAYLDDDIILVKTERELGERFECLLGRITGYDRMFNWERTV